MLVMINCGKLSDKKHQSVQNKIDNFSQIKDWIRYLDSNWIVEYKGDNFEDLESAINNDDDNKTSILISPLHYYHGRLNKDIWSFIKKYKTLPEPAKIENKNDDKNSNIISPENFVFTNAHTLEDLHLDSETGQMINAYFTKIAFNQAAKEQGVFLPVSHQNILLPGKPGVGKSTLAKSIALKLKNELTHKQKINCYFIKPAQLIGSYRGHTQINMQTLLEEASDGIVILDEIDTYLDLDSDDKMILNVLNTHLGDHPNKPIVIGTLYESSLQRFYGFNQGLQSRFPQTLRIEEQNNQKLTDVFERIVKDSNLEIENDALVEFKQLLQQVRNAQGQNFGFIRDVNNIFGKSIENMAQRHSQNPDNFTFKVIRDDIPQRNSQNGALEIKKSRHLTTTSPQVLEFPSRR